MFLRNFVNTWTSLQLAVTSLQNLMLVKLPTATATKNKGVPPLIETGSGALLLLREA